MSYFVEESFFITTLLPFLNHRDKVSVLSINKNIHTSCDIDRVWHTVVPQLKHVGKVNIKKTIHFCRLMRRYSMYDLVQEVCNQRHWDVLVSSLQFYPRGMGRLKLKTLVQSMIPPFLRKGNSIFYRLRNGRVPIDTQRLTMHELSMHYCLNKSTRRRIPRVK